MFHLMTLEHYKHDVQIEAPVSMDNIDKEQLDGYMFVVLPNKVEEEQLED